MDDEYPKIFEAEFSLQQTLSEFRRQLENSTHSSSVLGIRRSSCGLGKRRREEYNDESSNILETKDEGGNQFGRRSLLEGLEAATEVSRLVVDKGLFSARPFPDKTLYNLVKRKRNLRVYEKKKTLHTSLESSERVAQTKCCTKRCVERFSATDILKARKMFWTLKQPEQLNFLLEQMREASYFSDEGELLELRVTFNKLRVCNTAWCKLYALSTWRAASLREKFRSGQRTYEHSSKRSSGLSASSGKALAWMRNYFRLNTESMPNSEEYHLSDTLLRKDVYEFFLRECGGRCAPSTVPSLPQFQKIWREHFPKVIIPSLKRFSVCAQCLLFKTGRSNADNRVDRGGLPKSNLSCFA